MNDLYRNIDAAAGYQVRNPAQLTADHSGKAGFAIDLARRQAEAKAAEQKPEPIPSMGAIPIPN